MMERGTDMGQIYVGNQLGSYMVILHLLFTGAILV